MFHLAVLFGGGFLFQKVKGGASESASLASSPVGPLLLCGDHTLNDKDLLHPSVSRQAEFQ